MFEREREEGRGNEEMCAIVITPLFKCVQLTLSSFIFGKNWLSSHVLTFISIQQQSELHTVHHRWKINIKLDTF